MTAPTTRPVTWHQRSLEETVAALGVTTAGLTTAEAARRLAEHGRNELAESKAISPWAIFLGQFKNLIVWILIVAGVISGLLGEGVDAIAILAIVVLNAVIGFYQEYSAEKSIAALHKMTAPRAKVVRDGKVAVVPAAEVVPVTSSNSKPATSWRRMRVCSKPRRCVASSRRSRANPRL